MGSVQVGWLSKEYLILSWGRCGIWNYLWSLRFSCGNWFMEGSPLGRKSWKDWYVANVSIIFDAPCLFYTNCFLFCLHFVAFLCIFWN
jgi:hypothetical protein